MIEAALIFHQAVQRRFTGMPEGRVTEIMGKADRLHQVLVAPQCPGHRPPDLRDFQGVRQSRPVIITFVVDEDLRFVLQPPERTGVQDTITVALERGAVFRLRVRLISPPTRFTALEAIRGQRLRLALF